MVTSVSLSNLSNALTFTASISLEFLLVKPLFGIRLYSGICPPSNPGFKNRNSKEIIAINVDVLNRFEDGTDVTVETLLESRAISKAGYGVKILGNGELTKKLNVKVNAVSETAKAKIEAAGGTVEVI